MDLAVSTSHKQFIAHESFRYFIWRWPGNAITGENSGKGGEKGAETRRRTAVHARRDRSFAVAGVRSEETSPARSSNVRAMSDA